MRGFHVATSIFLLCLVLAFGQVLAGENQRNLNGADENVAVTIDRTAIYGSTLKSCYKPKRTNFNGRFHKIILGTAVFKRVILHMLAIEFYSDMENVTAIHIKECAEKTSVAGFAGFHFSNKLCKMFTPKHQFCRCDVGYGDAIYVQDFFWDTKDRVLPEFLQIMDERYFGGLARFPSAIINLFLRNPEKTPFESFVGNFASGDGYMTRYPGVTHDLVQNNMVLGFFSFVDIERCTMDCGLPSPYTIRHLIGHGLSEVDQVSPPVFLLSDCGKTITFDKNYTLRTAGHFLRLMSHEGYGCKLYPKPEVDHDCAVTIDTPFFTTPYILISPLSVDGKDTADGCEGDFVKIYNGNNTDSEPVVTQSFCRALQFEQQGDFNLPVTIVFTRSATQYRPKNETNLGFTISIGDEEIK